MPLTFKQSSFAALFYTYCEGQDVLPDAHAGPQVLYLLPEGTQTSGELGLQASWEQYQGCYIFLDTPLQIGAEQAFVYAAWSYLREPSYRTPRFAWFANPNEAAQGLNGQVLSVHRREKDQPPVTHQIVIFDLDSLALLIGKGCPVSLDLQHDSFSIAQPGDERRRISLWTDAGATALYVVGQTLTIPLCGPQSGCLQFAVTLQQTDGLPDFVHLDVGLRLFFRDPSYFPDADPFFITSQRYPIFNEEQGLVSLSVSIDPLAPLDQSRTYFAFTAPPTNAPDSGGVESYYCNNLGHRATLTPAENARLIFTSYPLTSIPGAAASLYLVPQGDFAVTVPAVGPPPAGTQPSTQPGAGTQSAANGVPPSPSDLLMCGLSGVEYLKLADSATDLLSFQPGMAAYAQGFVPGVQVNTADLSLTGLASTSWLYPRRQHQQTGTDPGPVVYCAQPDDAVLHKNAQQNGQVSQSGPTDPTAIVDGSLVYMEVPSTYLPAAEAAADGQTALAFPMLPYGNVRGDLQAIGQLEFELVSLARKQAITAIIKNHPAPAPTVIHAAAQAGTQTGVTPQGLLAEYSADYETLNQVLLARTDGGSDLYLQNIERNTDLWNALQSNQLFLVITDPTTLKDHLAGAINIQGWTFHVEPDNWRADTVLIFKFFNNKTLRDLVQSPRTWTMADVFNNLAPIRPVNEATASSLQDTSSTALPRLPFGSDEVQGVRFAQTGRKEKGVPHALELINQAIQYAITQCCKSDPNAASDPSDCLASGKCPGATDFENFIYEVLLNPRWNGILALNVPITGLPDQLKSLAAGLNTDQFFAHHVGINASPIQHNASTGQLTLLPSSIFGLINYDDPTLLAAAVDYSFKVLTLKVLFQNSTIAHFSSSIDLQVNTLFREQVSLNGGVNNNVIFNGTYQNHDGIDAYIFTNQSVNTFVSTSPVLNSVTFNQGQFITLATQTGQSQLQSKFVFWGNIDFKALPAFDALSFGSGTQSQGQLAFANMAIIMTSGPLDPSQPGLQTFTFDTSHLTVDLARSQARSDSLYSLFPLKLTAFTGDTSGVMPTDQGYMSVTSPLTQGILTTPWYGLQFELELGSLGALAAQAGFIANLLVAWSPAYGGDYKVFVGLKLPGSSGNQHEITLQGLLKIRIKNIQFVAVAGNNAQGATSASYMLRLQTISLGFMTLSLPPSGRTDFLLFGNPNASGDNKTLGWYAVYDKGVKPTPKPPPLIPGFSGNGGTAAPGGGQN